MAPEVKHSPPAISSLRLVLSLTLVASFSGAFIVLGYYLTLPYVEKNKTEYLEKAVKSLMPAAQRFTTRYLRGDKLSDQKPEKGAYVPVYTGFDADGKQSGFVVEASGSGFQDIIRLIYAWSPEGYITGLKVLESKETPGLGDKIEKDQAFIDNFKKLDVRLADDGRHLHDIETVKSGKKTDGWQIDGITGATISSKAIGRILQQSTTAVLPVLIKSLKKEEG